MSEYNKLSDDYDTSIEITDTDESSSPRSTMSRNNNPLMSSGSSVSSKLSRSSRLKKKSDLGMPLTSSFEDDGDEGSESQWIGGGGGGVTSPTNNAHAFAEDDPFYMFRGDLVKKLLLVDGELDRYLTVVRNTDTAVNTHEVKETKKQLKRQIKHAESTLADLETTVRVVERQRDNFKHINDNEINERRDFVDSSKNRISRAKSGMQSEEVKQKFVRDERALTERRAGGRPNHNNMLPQESNNSGDDSFLEEGRSETLMMMQKQDETLENLDMAVTRVGYMAETIHEEIDQQNKMLTDLDDDLADAEEQLGVVMGKLAKLLKTKNKCQIGLIIILSLIVLLLFFLVVYT